jgi:hypothetical protein
VQLQRESGLERGWGRGQRVHGGEGPFRLGHRGGKKQASVVKMFKNVTHTWGTGTVPVPAGMFDEVLFNATITLSFLYRFLKANCKN